MFLLARSHGRALHAVIQPCARLNPNTNIGRPTWNGRLQQRQHWSRHGGKTHKELYEAEYAAAKKLKETGIFVPKRTPGFKKAGSKGDGGRVNLVNPKLASTMPLPSGVPPPPQHPVGPRRGLIILLKSCTADQSNIKMMLFRTSNRRLHVTRDAI